MMIDNWFVEFDGDDVILKHVDGRVYRFMDAKIDIVGDEMIIATGDGLVYRVRGDYLFCRGMKERGDENGVF